MVNDTDACSIFWTDDCTQRAVLTRDTAQWLFRHKGGAREQRAPIGYMVREETVRPTRVHCYTAEGIVLGVIAFRGQRDTWFICHEER